MPRLTLAAVALAFLAGPALQAEAQTPPLPRPRPEAPPAPAKAEEVTQDEAGAQPDGAEAATEDAAEEEREVAEPAIEESVVDEEALEACERQLRVLGVEFERREPIDGEGACGVAAPYNVREIAEGVILKPDTELTCETALAMARWVQGFVVPAAQALGDGVRLAEITHVSTYVCRKRNNIETNRISEHATGRAIDISGFDLDGHDPIPVVPRAGRGTAAEAFQRTVRASACLYFTTVLGPGSNGFHDDHLHFDVIRRPSGYRLCQ